MLKRKLYILWILILFVLSSITVLAKEIGLSQVPDFSLTDFQGKKFTLSDELKKNKVILLWFTNLCGGCQEKTSEMEKIKNLYKKKGVELVAVSVLGRDRKTVENIIQNKNLSFKFLYDPEGTVGRMVVGQYVQGTCPVYNIFFIDRNRKIIFKDHYPGMKEDKIKNILNKITGGAQ